MRFKKWEEEKKPYDAKPWVQLLPHDDPRRVAWDKTLRRQRGEEEEGQAKPEPTQQPTPQPSPTSAQKEAEDRRRGNADLFDRIRSPEFDLLVAVRKIVGEEEYSRGAWKILDREPDAKERVAYAMIHASFNALGFKGRADANRWIVNQLARELVERVAEAYKKKELFKPLA